MQHYDRFVFEDFDFDPTTRRISLRYSLDDAVHFTETLDLPQNTPFITYDQDTLQHALFALHLAGGASYYKTYCPKTIEVRSGALNSHQAAFWNKLYTHGLGEFFYVNKIDFRGLINFPADNTAEAAMPARATETPAKKPINALTAFGGGKDSIVSMELLRANNIQQSLFRVRPHAIVSELAQTAQLPLLKVIRTLDPQLHELRNQGALNGHVPITAYISFVSIVTAVVFGFDAVFFSNERSSSYGNVEYLGMQVNHQWSKSFEAEMMLRDYIADYVTADIQYLNLLRPLSELHIAKLFASHPQYFMQATSCNTNWTITAKDPSAHRWCGHCPKCAFSFGLLAAYLPARQVINIFQKNLFEDEQLVGLYRQLWGIDGFKPFECVGTPEEAQAAAYLACKQPELANTVIGRHFTEQILPNMPDPDVIVQTLLTPDFTATPAVTQQLVQEAL